MSKAFKHSGARGDLIYSLPALRALGGGSLHINRKYNSFFESKVSDEEMSGILEFMRTQSYMKDVLDWNGQTVDFDLDEFRKMETSQHLLSETYLHKFGVSFDLSQPWIETDKITANSKAEIVVSRTPRYHAPFDWAELTPWLDRSVFVGSAIEHMQFCKDTGFDIRHEVTKTWLELVQVILGSKLFIGNQSFAYSLAEGMKHNRILEVCLFCPNCDPQSSNGHVRLNQGLIGKYLLGKDFEDSVRTSRCVVDQLSFQSKKVRDDYRNVSCIIFGKNDKAVELQKECSRLGIETIMAEGDVFELAMNEGAKRTTRRILCFIDAYLCEKTESVSSVLHGMFSCRSGLVAASMSTWVKPHASGSCFAISRDVYERAGLFNMALRPGEARMLEMVLRYERLGITCRSMGVMGWSGRSSNEEDTQLNLEYLKRNFGVMA